MTKNRIDNAGLKVFNKDCKSMGMEDEENVSGKSIKSKVEGDVFIVGELEMLSMRDPMEKLD